VIVFDKRGQGLSDRVAEQTIDERVADISSVMDAASSERATIYGWSEGGQLSITFAAHHPERTAAMVLYGSYASMRSEPWIVNPELFDSFVSSLMRHWGEGILVKINAPSRRKDEAFLKWFGRLERAVASPGAIEALLRANYELDVNPLLPSIQVPTLILHRVGDAQVPVEAGRHLAWNIPGSKYFELPGEDHLLQAFDLDVLDMLIDRIEEFVTGSWPERRPEEILADHVRSKSPNVQDDARVDAADVADDSLSEAIAELERCRETIASGGDVSDIEGLLARVQALVASSTGSWQDSESQFVRAISNFRRHKLAWQEARTFEIWGRSLMAGLDRRGLIERLDSTIQGYRRQSLANGNGAIGTKIKADEASLPAVLRREGDFWTTSWQGKTVRLKDAKGLHYIAYLLANAGRQVPAHELAVSGKSAQIERFATLDRTVASLGDAGPVIDSTARERYKVRINELRSELDDAERLNDTGRAAGLRWELESLSDQIASSVGLRGRARTDGSHRERARQMVTKSVKAAIAKVCAGNPALGHHLATSIKTGNFCTYDPGPQNISWQL
jgi:hypothetical protein